jgi:hypothetical protein
MKSLITTLITIGLLAPAGASYAFSIQEMIEAAKGGNGTYVESHSSVSTGGQTVKNGETVITGDSSASSHVETRINAGNNGGEVSVKVETSENGKTETKEFTQPIKEGGVKVEANAEIKNGEYKAEVKVNDEPVEASQSSKAGAQVASVSPVTSESKVSLLFTTRIPDFFKKLFGFLW